MMPVADDNDPVNPLAMSGDGFASTLARYGLATIGPLDLRRADGVKEIESRKPDNGVFFLVAINRIHKAP